MKIITTINKNKINFFSQSVVFMLISVSGLTGCNRDKAQPKSLSSLAGHNLLLITLDTTRADRLGCYGYAEAH